MPYPPHPPQAAADARERNRRPKASADKNNDLTEEQMSVGVLAEGAQYGTERFLVMVRTSPKDVLDEIPLRRKIKDVSNPEAA